MRILFLVIFLVGCQTQGEIREGSQRYNEIDAWGHAVVTDEISTYEDFIKKYPHLTDYVRLARNKIKVLTDEKQHGTSFWPSTLSKNTVRGYEEYILRYPNSKYLSEAKLRLDWLKALAIGTEEAVLKFKEKSIGNTLANEIKVQGERFLADQNTPSDLNAFSKRWPELTSQINAKRAEIDEIEISKLLDLARAQGTSTKLYQFGLKRQAAGDLDGASKAYNTIVEKLPDGDFVVESLEKLLEVKATREQIARDEKAEFDEFMRKTRELTDRLTREIEQEKAAKAAEEAKREAERKARQERRDQEQSQREAEHNKIMEYYKICEREWKALQKRCKSSDVDCLNGATDHYGICLRKYNLR